MSTKPETLEQQATEVLRRRDVIAAELSTAEAALEAERDALGNAVALGEDTGKHRARLRELEEDAEGLRRALPILDQKRDALVAEMNELRLSNARTAYEQEVERVRGTAEKMDEALRSFLLGDLAALRAEMNEALVAERTAASAYEAIAREAGQALTTRLPSGWQGTQALPTLLALIDQYTSHGQLHMGKAIEQQAY